METVTLKMEESLLEAIDKSLSKNRYSTRTEFIRESVRHRLTELEKEEAIRKIEAAFGSMKGKARMSEAKARELAVKEIADELGVKLD